jgi:hypothetical protein
MTDLRRSYKYDVESWIIEVGWPTENSDTLEALRLYHEWIEIYPRNLITGVPDGNLLIDNISHRMNHIHNKHDATIITSLLILKLSSLARIDGINPND